MKYDLVIFDLDGTILNTIDDLHTSTNAALQSLSMPLRTRDEVLAFVGNGIRRLLELSAPENSAPETIDALQQAFTAHYKQHCNDQTCPYDGIPELLRALRGDGYKIAVVSNKDDYAVRALCELHFHSLIDVAIGCREGVRKKPAPDSVNEVLHLLNIDRRRAIYVGDSEVDFATANNAEMDQVIVTWGFRSEASLREIGCTNFARTVDELRQKLESN